MAAFLELGLMQEIVQSIEEMDWLLPTDVQHEAIPLVLGGGDVLMAAETGSGKTGAFSLPIIQIVQETKRARKEGRVGRGKVGQGDMSSQTVTLNPFDRGELFAISPDGLLCQCRDHRVWHGSRSTHGVASGKYYFEATVTDEGLCRVGWSTPRATHELGKDNFGFGFGGTGKKSYSSQFDDYGERFGNSDTIGCYIDIDQCTVGFSKNGNYLGKAFDIPKHLHGETFYAAVTLKNAEMQFNFGDTPFKYTPQSGYTGVSKASDLVPFQSTGTESGNRKRGGVMALIMEPARELAQQTHENITRFKRHLSSPGVRELLLVGGDSAKDQMRALQEGVDVVTGTPGRLDDFISTGKLDLSGVRFFVLDEADGLLSGGHGNLITKIYNQIPKVTPEGSRLQMIVCSATLHHVEVKKLANKLMHFPTWVDLKGQDTVPETVHHVLCHVDPVTDTAWHNQSRTRVETDGVHFHDNVKPGSRSAECLSEAVKVLKGDYLVKAIRKHKMDQAIVFCRTKLDCDNIERYLLKLGGGPSKMVNEFSCVCLHSDRRPQERKENLMAFKNGEVRFLICTDVAARGIDITGIPFVINVTLSDDKQNYIHRIGRVGRAEKMGLAISIVSTVKEKVWYHKCPSRGKSCRDTTLVEDGGCTIWYDERQYLADIEEHLGVTIPEVDNSFDVPVNEFDGKITYGEKRGTGGPSVFQYHTQQLAPSVEKLAKMELQAQTNFLRVQTSKSWLI